MTREPHVLIVDDNQSYRQTLTDVLRKQNFAVHAVADAGACLEALDQHYYHAVMLQDSQGLVVLDKLESEGRSKIAKFFILQQNWSNENIRDQYRSHRYKKTFDEIITQQTFIAAADPFFNYIRTIIGNIRLDLDIHYEVGLGSREIVERLLAARLPVRFAPDADSLTEEFELMLCDLLADYDRVFLSQLSAGYSGSSVLLVNAYVDERETEVSLIKVGGHQDLHQEYENFLQYVHHYLRGGRMANAVKFAGTAHFGGILYTFLGNEAGSRLQEFGEMYRQATAASEIIHILDKLFNDTCHFWYRNRMELRTVNLTSYYRRFMSLNPDVLRNALEKLSSVDIEGDQITFRNLSSDTSPMMNPLLLIDGAEFSWKAYICFTHGDLNERNILVNGLGTAWLIDFRYTGDNHILRDLAALDTAIRIGLLEPDTADLDVRYQLEQALMRAEKFETLPDLVNQCPIVDPVIDKAYQSIIYLRQLAYHLTKDNPDTDINEYYVALFYFAIRAIKFTDTMTSTQREHALLSASLLAKRLRPFITAAVV
jgi:CheY-like chemotaxis protein